MDQQTRKHAQHRSDYGMGHCILIVQWMQLAFGLQREEHSDKWALGRQWQIGEGFHSEQQREHHIHPTERHARTKRCSERKPADSLRNKSNVIGGWLPSLTFALAGKSSVAVKKAIPLLKLASVLAASLFIQRWVGIVTRGMETQTFAPAMVARMPATFAVGSRSEEIG